MRYKDGRSQTRPAAAGQLRTSKRTYACKTLKMQLLLFECTRHAIGQPSRAELTHPVRKINSQYKNKE